MTVETNDSLERYTISGNGPYAFSFRIFDETDLSVTALESGDLDPVAFTYGVHYSVASVNDEDGGSITLLGTTATTYASHTLDIRSNVPREQPTSIKNQGSFAPQVHETAFDRLSRQIQDLYRQVRQSFRYPDNVDLDAKMEDRSSWASKYLYVNSDGEIEPAASVGSTALTQSVIGETLYPRTAAEIDAGVTPVNYAKLENHIERYGSVDLTGVTDSSTAINTCLSVNGIAIFPKGIIRWDTKPTIPAFETLYLYGYGDNITTLYVGDQTGYTFPITNSQSATHFVARGLTLDGSNGGNAATDASTTWDGFFKCTKTSGVGVYRVFMEDMQIRSTAVAGGACIDLGTAYFVELNRCRLSHAVNGYSLLAGGSSASTTVTLNKCYLNFSRQGYKFTANVTDVAFNNCVVESCCVGGHAMLAQVTFNNSYFENLGYDILGTSRDGITNMGGSVSFGNALDSTECDAGFTQLYGTLTFNECRWSNAHTDLSAWIQVIGTGSAIGGDGLLVINGGTNTETTKAMFRTEVASERGDFTIVVNDGARSVNSSVGVLRLYSDQRKVNKGLTKVIFAGAVRLAEINRGKFTYGYGLDATYSAGLSDQPTGGQNEVGDEVVFTAPAAIGFTRSKCTTAGSPGTWSNYMQTGAIAVTVAGLPAAAAANSGLRAIVTDANATTIGSTVAGGGANRVSVNSDGTNWIIG